MKIDQVSCKRFAGIQDKTISFENGLNILVGKNEAGKSTVIDLIYQILYHDIDLSLNTLSSHRTASESIGLVCICFL